MKLFEKILWNCLLGALLLAAAWFVFTCFTGCKSSKVVKREQVFTSSVHADTMVAIDTNMIRVVVDDMWRYAHGEETTVEGVPGDVVVLVEAVDNPRDTVIKKGRTTLRAYTDSKGQRHIECNSDSLLQVITRKDWDSVRNSRKYDSSLFMARVIGTHSDTSSTLKSVVDREQAGWWSNFWQKVKSGVVVLFVGAVIGFCVGYMCRAHVAKWVA